TVRMEITVTPSLRNDGDVIILQKKTLELFKSSCRTGTFFNGISEKIFLCLECCGCRPKTFLHNFLIDPIQFFLTMCFSPELSLCYFLWSGREKVDLMKALPFTHFHNFFFQMVQKSIRGSEFISGLFFMWFIHI